MSQIYRYATVFLTFFLFDTNLILIILIIIKNISVVLCSNIYSQQIILEVIVFPNYCVHLKIVCFQNCLKMLIKLLIFRNHRCTSMFCLVFWNLLLATSIAIVIAIVNPRQSYHLCHHHHLPHHQSRVQPIRFLLCMTYQRTPVMRPKNVKHVWIGF